MQSHLADSSLTAQTEHQLQLVKVNNIIDQHACRQASQDTRSQAGTCPHAAMTVLVGLAVVRRVVALLWGVATVLRWVATVLWGVSAWVATRVWLCAWVASRGCTRVPWSGCWVACWLTAWIPGRDALCGVWIASWLRVARGRDVLLGVVLCFMVAVAGAVAGVTVAAEVGFAVAVAVGALSVGL